MDFLVENNDKPGRIAEAVISQCPICGETDFHYWEPSIGKGYLTYNWLCENEACKAQGEEQFKLTFEGHFDVTKPQLKNDPSFEKEVEANLVDLFSKIGMDRPSNFDEMLEYVAEDVRTCSGYYEGKWTSSDVAIAFRRFIERE